LLGALQQKLGVWGMVKPQPGNQFSWRILMAFAMISAILLIILVVIAIRFGFNRDQITNDDCYARQPTMHASGIYSIVRNDPRENVMSAKPSSEDLSKYILGLNEDINGQPISQTEKAMLIDAWETALNESIAAIKQGDESDVGFYYYDFQPVDCPVCKRHISKGKFVTREEIYFHPSIIPPFHPGCTCKLIPYHGKENLRETTELGMLPFFKNQEPPVLPDWKNSVKITSMI
jgi:hypothetical protein